MFQCKLILPKARSTESDETEERGFKKLPIRNSHISFGKPARLVCVKSVTEGPTQSIVYVRELDMIERKMKNRPPGCPVTFI